MANMTSTTICPVCGRCLPPKKPGRGRPKEKHRECLVLESRLNEVADLLRVCRFAPPTRAPGSNKVLGKAGDMRSRLNEIWRNFTVKAVREAPRDDCTEYYSAWEAQRRAKR